MRPLVQRLARWAARWSPLVEVDGADVLRLDVTGVAHLFGGEAGLVARRPGAASPRLALTRRLAIAPTAAAAWALAHYGSAAAASSAARTRARSCAALPVAALRLLAGSDADARAAGPEDRSARWPGSSGGSLARRFREADNPVDALDRALGRKPEPLTAVPADRPPRACSSWKSRRPIPKRRARRWSG